MIRTRNSLFTLLLVMPGTFAGGKDPMAPAPAYDTTTEVQFEGVVSEVRQVSSGPLQGIYLTVKTKSESVDLYLGPAEFIKLFDVQFKNGNGVEVTGSKVKFEGRDLVLGREVRLGKTTLVLRGAKGAPNWMWLSRSFPTGL
jgi:hypothetical protein